MATRLFRCPSCGEAAQMDAMTMAESPVPLFYTCTHCQAQYPTLPDEVHGSVSKQPAKRRLGVF